MGFLASFLSDLKERISLRLEIMYENYTGTSTYQSNNSEKSARSPLLLLAIGIMTAFLTIRAARRLGNLTNTYMGGFSKPRLFGKRSSVYSSIDAFEKLGQSAIVADTSMMKDYGGVDAFQGIIATASCAWGGCSLERVLQQRGHGRVLVVDGVGDMKKALLDQKLAHLAHSRGWKGIILNGCIRSATSLKKVPIGVKALGTHLRISGGADATIEQRLSFSGVEFIPGQYIYADSDGIVVSAKSADVVKWSLFGNKNKNKHETSSFGDVGGGYGSGSSSTYGSSGGLDGGYSYNSGGSTGSFGSGGSAGYGTGGSTGYGTGGSTSYGSTAYESGGSRGYGTGDSTSYGTGGSTSYGTGASTGYGAGGSTGYGTGGSTGYGTGGSTGYGTGGSTGYGTGGSTGYGTGGSTGYGTGGSTGGSYGSGGSSSYGSGGSSYGGASGSYGSQTTSSHFH